MRQSELIHNIYNALEIGNEAIEAYRPADYSWYETAKVQTKLFSDAMGTTPEVSALVLAGASRATSVWQSFVRSEIYLRTGTVYFAGDYIDSLLERYRTVGKFGSATSPKVSAFCRNILEGDSDTLTVDRHAISLAIGEKVAGAPDTVLSKIRRAYHVVARDTGLPQSEVQSIAWIGWRSIDSQFQFHAAEHGRHHADVFADFTPMDYLESIDCYA